MKNDNDRKDWANILDKVRTILALSGLVVLAAGAALTAVLWNLPQQERFTTWLVMIGFLLAVVVANMIYSYCTQQEDLPFGIQVHVARREKDVEQGCNGALVKLYKNGALLQEAYTDEMGLLPFLVKLGKKDVLYVIVIDTETGKQSNKAALYSAGQFHMSKKIVL